MSLIGTLDQFSLAHVLQRIEMHGKTGRCKIQRGTQWAELYFREGRLLCLGPVRNSASLGERLLESGVISAQALQEAKQTLGDAPFNETHIAITLMDLGHVSRDELRAWATKEASAILQATLNWSGGELYFEDEVPPPSERLLVSLSVTALLPTPAAPDQNPAVRPAAVPASPVNQVRLVPTQGTHQFDVEHRPTPLEPSQSGSETALASPALPDSPLPVASLLEDVSLSFTESQPQEPAQPQIQPLTPLRVDAPVPSRQIDISFLRPEMVLVPVDFSRVRGGNQRLQITPEQWRLLTRVDSRTTLQVACMELGCMPAQVCQLAGELIAGGLVTVAMPTATVDELSPVSRDLIASGLGNGYVAPGAAAAPAAPFAAVTPTTDALRPSHYPAFSQVETQSQWGNGGNGATFVPGRGWVTGITGSQPLPSLPPGSSSYVATAAYVQAGEMR